MNKKVLFGLDSIFTCLGTFWACLVLFRLDFSAYLVFDWLVLISLIAVFFFPLIRKIVEVLSEMNWEDLKYAFKQNYKNRAKKRWEY